MHLYTIHKYAIHMYIYMYIYSYIPKIYGNKSCGDINLSKTTANWFKVKCYDD